MIVKRILIVATEYLQVGDFDVLICIRKRYRVDKLSLGYRLVSDIAILCNIPICKH